MSTSVHKFARFEDVDEKFVLVQVDSEWAKKYGEKAVRDALEAHPQMVDHGLPILTAHVDGDTVNYFGKPNLAKDVAAFGWSNIKWEEEELSLEWADEDGEEGEEDEEEGKEDEEEEGE